MFNNIRLKNYKSLVDVEMNLTKANKAKNLVLLYGENGSGKSNLASAFMTLMDTFRTLSTQEYVQKFVENNRATEMDPDEKARFFDFISDNFKDIETIIKDCKTIGSEENMSLEYTFELNNVVGTYLIEMDECSIVAESLYYLIDKRRGFHFKLKKDERIILNPNIFTNTNYYNEIVDKVERYWGKHSLLGIILNEYNDVNVKYLEERVSNNLIEIISFLGSLNYQVFVSNRGQRCCFEPSFEMFLSLNKGEIDILKEQEINLVEEFLNEIFTSLYADIKKVYYKRDIKEEKIKYDLFFKKQIGGKIRDISFNMESRGTLNILSLIPFIYEAIKGKVVIIDEFDSGIHDLLIEKLIISIKKYIKGQLIITTHNTMLMESGVSGDSMYFIRINELGNKSIACLSEYSNRRVHPNNNMRSLYIKGAYDAIPIMSEGELDFEELSEILGDD